jgi:hypothetical protein
MGMQHAFVSEFDVRTDHAKRANADIVSNLCERRNDGGRVDHKRDFRASGRL